MLTLQARHIKKFILGCSLPLQPSKVDPEVTSSTVHPVGGDGAAKAAVASPQPVKAPAPTQQAAASKPAPARPAAADSEQSEKISTVPAPAAAGGAAILAKLRCGGWSC
jgi:hypothetical protein